MAPTVEIAADCKVRDVNSFFNKKGGSKFQIYRQIITVYSATIISRVMIHNFVCFLSLTH
jgi:ArsR family metal-binding transcriptional regulator